MMKNRIIKHSIKYSFLGALIFIIVVFGVATQRAYTAQNKIPDVISQNSNKIKTQANRPVLRVMTLNAAHGRGLTYNQLFLNREEIANNLVKIAEQIHSQAPDVVAIQEIDGPSFWSGGFDQVEAIANHSGYSFYKRGEHGQFDSWRFKVSSGTAITSRLKLTNAKSKSFNQTWRDNKGYVIATITSPIDNKTKIDIVSLHTDFLNAWVRNKQLNLLKAEIKERGNAVIVMGDFNCDFDAKVSCIKAFSGELRLKAYQPDQNLATFPANEPKRRLDWVLISDNLTFKSYKRLKEITSDHLGLVAEIGHN